MKPSSDNRYSGQGGISPMDSEIYEEFFMPASLTKYD